MNKNKIFAIFILFGILITCAGVSFASSDLDTSYMDYSDMDDYIDEDLDDGLDDEDDDLNDDWYDDLDDDSEEDLDDDDWDDDTDDDSDDDWDDDDWDDDFDDDWDDDDWDDDFDDDWDDDDWDDDDWDDDFDYDWDESDFQFYYYDDLDFADYEIGNITKYNSTYGYLTYLKNASFPNNATRYKYMVYYAKALGAYHNTSDNEQEDYNDTESDNATYEYLYGFIMPKVLSENYAASSTYSVDVSKSIDLSKTLEFPKSIDLSDLKDTLSANQSQTNKTDKNDIEQVDIQSYYENNGFIALLALFILCLLAII